MPRKPRAKKTDTAVKPIEQRAPETVEAPRAVGRGGRLTRDTASGLGLFGSMTVLPPSDPAGDWRKLDLDSRTLSRISANKLAEYLLDLSPEVSKALFDFLRECNPGYELKAYRPGTDEVDEQAQLALDAFISQLDDRQDGIFDVTISRLFLGMFLRGAFLAELVLDKDGRTPIDLATPDPWLVRWRRVKDDVLDSRLVLCQWQDGRLVDLDAPTIRYVPVDPAYSPYGRPLVAPALFVCLFLLATMHDLRRVVQQQGYPRHDIEIALAEVAESLKNTRGSVTYEELVRIADSVRLQVEEHIAAMQPDDTLVHTSMVKVNKPVGAVDSTNMGGLAAIIEWLERMAVRALKTAPFMMAVNQSTTETQANRQFESHMLGIRTLQHYAETPLSRLFTLMLQAQGIVATVKMRFNVNRASERQRDAQTEALEIANARARYDHGWISQDAAAQQGADVEVADVPEPRTGGTDAAATDPESQENPEPGTSRSLPLTRSRQDRRTKLVPLGADQPFEPLGDVAPLSEDERAALSGLLDRSMTGSNGRYKGMLDAEVVDGEDSDA